VKAVLLDVGGTLDADGEHWRSRFYRVFSKYGYKFSVPEFDRAYFHADDFLPQNYPLQNMGFYDTVRALAESVSRQLHGSSWIDSQITADFYSSAMVYFQRNKKILAELKKNFKIALVSNYYGNLKNALQEAGIHQHIDAAVDSNCVGFRKPDPWIFQIALKAISAFPAEVLFVGDSYERDVMGAQRLGIKPVWLVSNYQMSNGKNMCGISRLQSLLHLPHLVESEFKGSY